MRVVLVFTLLLTSCREPALETAEAMLDVTPAELDFGRVTIGTARTLQLTFEGRADGTLAIEAPFTVDSATFTAPATREISFTPTSDGVFSANLQVASTAGIRSVSIRGEGVAKTNCVSNDPCVASRWSDDEARCVLEPLPEDSVCGSSCVISGRCQAGICVGALASCEDADLCTADSCDAASGCRHTPRECESPNPCLAARCDPALGCGTSAVEDGLDCGPRDCATAHVCLSGECVERPVPDGSACGTASYCQAAGTCVAGSCNQPPAHSLPLLWSRTVTNNGLVDFPGVTDSAGNLFWFECKTLNCFLVSVTPAGALRYEVPTALTGIARRYLRPAPLIISGELIIFGWDGVVEARRHADGALVWSATLPFRTLGNLMERRTVTDLAAHPPDALYVAGTFFPDWMGGDYEPTISRLDLRTGALAWEHWNGPSARGAASIELPSVVVDSTGQPVFAGTYHSGIGTTQGLTAQGAVRWSSNAGPVAVTAVIGDRVFHSRAGWFDARGLEHLVPRFQNIVYPKPLETNAGVVVIGVDSPLMQLKNEWNNWQTVPLFDFLFWPPRASEPRLNASGEISFAHSGQHGPLLYDFAPDGHFLAACPLGLTSYETVDMQQPVVELPGLVVLVDTGRNIVRAFQR